MADDPVLVRAQVRAPEPGVAAACHDGLAREDGDGASAPVDRETAGDAAAGVREQGERVRAGQEGDGREGRCLPVRLPLERLAQQGRPGAGQKPVPAARPGVEAGDELALSGVAWRLEARAERLEEVDAALGALAERRGEPRVVHAATHAGHLAREACRPWPAGRHEAEAPGPS